VGGGVIGCSTAYHLSKLGWKDILLVEQNKLTSGTTWHAAGLVGTSRATGNETRLSVEGTKLYMALEEETGLATGDTAGAKAASTFQPAPAPLTTLARPRHPAHQATNGAAR
jgi:glycine/D-amino acid oxidase-like deaminating enzyme